MKGVLTPDSRRLVSLRSCELLQHTPQASPFESAGAPTAGSCAAAPFKGGVPAVGRPPAAAAHTRSHLVPGAFQYPSASAISGASRAWARGQAAFLPPGAPHVVPAKLSSPQVPPPPPPPAARGPRRPPVRRGPRSARGGKPGVSVPRRAVERILWGAFAAFARFWGYLSFCPWRSGWALNPKP